MSAQVRPDVARPHFLMCRPEHFGVVYSINPWMNPTGWARDQQALAAASHVQFDFSVSVKIIRASLYFLFVSLHT